MAFKAENVYNVQAFLIGVHNGDEEFRLKFKEYTENLYDSEKLIEDSKINVDVIYVQVDMNENETEIVFHLKTINIEISEWDLEVFQNRLDDTHRTVFDKIFENFDVQEFENYLSADNRDHSRKYEIEKKNELLIDQDYEIAEPVTIMTKSTENFELNVDEARNENFEISETFSKISCWFVA